MKSIFCMIIVSISFQMVTTAQVASNILSRLDSIQRNLLKTPLRIDSILSSVETMPTTYDYSLRDTRVTALFLYYSFDDTVDICVELQLLHPYISAQNTLLIGADFLDIKEIYEQSISNLKYVKKPKKTMQEIQYKNDRRYVGQILFSNHNLYYAMERLCKEFTDCIFKPMDTIPIKER